MLTKICSKCGTFYPANESCQCRSQRHKQYDMFQRNKESQAVYHSKQWPILTQMCKARCNGIDMYKLMTTGRVVLARNGLCHHIIEVTEDLRLAYDIDNLFYVGNGSHAEIHKIYNRSEKEKRELQDRMKKFILSWVRG